MRATAALSILWAFSLCHAAGEAPELKSLYEGHQWFRLRESVMASSNPPPFYRAVVAMVFHEDARVDRALQEVMRSAPGSWEAAEADRLRGQFRQRNDRRLHKAVGGPQPSRIRYSIKLGNLYIPLTVNGRKVEYLFDTGAANSVVSETEAKRLGLRLYKSKGAAFDGATGGKIQFRHVGIARRLSVGTSELRNVLFLVFPDDTFFFEGRPPSENGILGLSAIQALKTVRWDAEGNFETGFSSLGENAAKPNLAFDEQGLAVEVGFEHHQLIFGLDTGAGESNLWVSFRDQFAELVKASGREEQRNGAGASGVIEYKAMMLPGLKFHVGGSETFLQPAEITLKAELGSGRHGNLGLDLLNQARVVTIDFQAMRITLEGPP